MCIFIYWDASNWLSLASILGDLLGITTSVIISIWIVNTLQRKIDNQRVLRDHLASEIIQIREHYRNFIKRIICEENNGRDIKTKQKILNMQVTDIMKILKRLYEIDENILYPYQVRLMEIIEADSNYENSYNTNKATNMTQETINEIIAFKSANEHLFNDILIEIYSSN